jgi:F-type H+-transporting ATPase subunit b
VSTTSLRPLLALADINVDLDLTFVAQLLLFVTFIIVLKPLLFDPLLRVFEAREQRTEGARQSAREMDEQAAELILRYEKELEVVRRDAAEDRDRLREETQRLEARILAEARADATRIIEEGKAKIATEVLELRRELEAQRPQLAAEIASKVLGREVQP